MKFLSMVAGVVAALGLVAAPVMAAQVDLLSDAQLAGIWAGALDENAVAVNDSNAATTGGEIDTLARDGSNAASRGGTVLNADVDVDDNAIAGTDAANNNSNIDSNNDSSTDVDVDVDVNVLSNVQNFANGVNMSNALLSLVTQQSNVLSNGSGSPHKVIQVNVNF